MTGFIILDKPAGITSRDAVNAMQRLLPRSTKIGHTGTLDPLATGVLVLCLGDATKLAEQVQAMPKAYATRIRLGATSTTDDADGTITETPDCLPISLPQIEASLPLFTGAIAQTPPAFSAVKVGGRRAHDLARRGHAVELTARTIHVHAIRIIHFEWPWLDLEIDCGKGTYIRSIARDLGQHLHCGGFVQTLRRTRVGPFRAEDGLTLPTTFESLKNRLIPPSSLVAPALNGHNA